MFGLSLMSRQMRYFANTMVVECAIMLVFSLRENYMNCTKKKGNNLFNIHILWWYSFIFIYCTYIYIFIYMYSCYIIQCRVKVAVTELCTSNTFLIYHTYCTVGHRNSHTCCWFGRFITYKVISCSCNT